MNDNTAILDQKYIQMLSSRLDRFKHKGRGVFICRCPICGDSKTDKAKTRFYFFQKDGKYNVYCHNCSYSHKFFTFLKEFDSGMFRDYSLEQFGATEPIEIVEEPKYKYTPNLSTITKISALPVNHPAKRYVVSRQIPAKTHYKLYFSPHFSNWIDSIIPDKINSKSKFDPRIILFMTDRDGNITGCQGRSINPKSKLRYITIRFDEAIPKIFGLDALNPNSTTYVLEGPIDSLFLENALAMTGSDVTVDDLVSFGNVNLGRTVFVYDNEPRNAEIVKKLEKAIDSNLKVCIWPNSMMKYGKDINEYILSGLTPGYIKDVIDNNTFSGLTAKMNLSRWRKDK